MTTGASDSAVIAAAASMPFMFGILTSMNTMSGRAARASVTASAPSRASATTS